MATNISGRTLLSVIFRSNLNFGKIFLFAWEAHLFPVKLDRNTLDSVSNQFLNNRGRNGLSSTYRPTLVKNGWNSIARNRWRERGKLPRLDVHTHVTIYVAGAFAALLHTRHTWSGLCRMHRNRSPGLSHSWAGLRVRVTFLCARLSGTCLKFSRARKTRSRDYSHYRLDGIKDATSWKMFVVRKRPTCF